MPPPRKETTRQPPKHTPKGAYERLLALMSTDCHSGGKSLYRGVRTSIQGNRSLREGRQNGLFGDANITLSHNSTKIFTFF